MKKSLPRRDLDAAEKFEYDHPHAPPSSFKTITCYRCKGKRKTKVPCKFCGGTGHRVVVPPTYQNAVASPIDLPVFVPPTIAGPWWKAGAVMPIPEGIYRLAFDATALYNALLGILEAAELAKPHDDLDPICTCRFCTARKAIDRCRVRPPLTNLFDP